MSDIFLNLSPQFMLFYTFITWIIVLNTYQKINNNNSYCCTYYLHVILKKYTIHSVDIESRCSVRDICISIYWKSHTSFFTSLHPFFTIWFITIDNNKNIYMLCVYNSFSFWTCTTRRRRIRDEINTHETCERHILNYNWFYSKTYLWHLDSETDLDLRNKQKKKDKVIKTTRVKEHENFFILLPSSTGLFYVTKYSRA